MTARLSIFLLGTLEARLEDQPVEGFEYNKVRALLAYLAVESRQPHSRTSLCSLLWPDLLENAARQNLSQALSQLRKLLGDKDAGIPFLLTTTDNVQPNPTASWDVDVALFTAQVALAEAHTHRGWHLCSPFEEQESVHDFVAYALAILGLRQKMVLGKIKSSLRVDHDLDHALQDWL